MLGMYSKQLKRNWTWLDFYKCPNMGVESVFLFWLASTFTQHIASTFTLDKKGQQSKVHIKD